MYCIDGKLLYKNDKGICDVVFVKSVSQSSNLILYKGVIMYKSIFKTVFEVVQYM